MKRSRRPEVSIIIPVYNEDKTIGKVLDKLFSINWGKHTIEVIVINDGSTDATGKVLLHHPLKRKIKLFRLRINRGKGAAVRAGIKHSTGKVVIIQDADLEYRPEDIPLLIKPILNGEYKVVYGSRFLGKIKKMSPIRRLANRFLTLYIRIIFNTSITDACTCYKTFKGGMLRKFNLHSNGFEFCHELTANVCRRHIDILELPIEYQARDNTENIKSTWKDLLKQLGEIIYFRFKSLS